MPCDFGFTKYPDSPLAESSRDVFLSHSQAIKNFTWDFLILVLSQSKRVTHSRWRDTVHVTPCVLTGIFLFSRQDLLLLQNESSCDFSQKSSPHVQSSLKHLFSFWVWTQLHWKSPMAPGSPMQSCKREMLFSVLGSWQVLKCYFLGNSWTISSSEARK